MLTEAADTVNEGRIQWFQFVGTKRPPGGWPAGSYRGEYHLTRDVDGQAKIIIDIKREIQVR